VSGDVVRFEITELNTIADDAPRFIDESPRIYCGRCGHWFYLGHGIFCEDPVMAAITYKHLELCEGDQAVTLMKIEQLYKSGWRPNALGGACQL
jgi:hypothetical protein